MGGEATLGFNYIFFFCVFTGGDDLTHVDAQRLTHVGCQEKLVPNQWSLRIEIKLISLYSLCDSRN